MNKGKQATLFQSWGPAKKSQAVNSKITDRGDVGKRPGPPSTDHAGIIDLCDGFEDDEDEDLLAQVVDMPGYSEPTAGTSSVAPPGDVCNISLGAESFPCNMSLTQTVAPEGFDKFAGKSWIYPTNYPVRDYQFNISQQALYKNTMVTLPTGLGKTFIAAVVMYNFYRWYPQGKVVFMAPTKPLVAQQIEACYNIMGIPQLDTAEMTGNMAPTERKRTWQEKRVFFLTPQVLTNDLSRGTCPAVRVRCLVVDEAHKALGNHAYCQVVRELIKYTESFRILALSATPGSDIKAVQQVLSNLLISHIELRTEESIDIKQFSHERKVEKIVVPLGDELTQVKKTYIQVMDVVVGRLKRQGVLYKRETTSFSKFLILKAREAFRQNPPQQLQRTQYGAVEGDLALAMSLYHGFELLQLHGQRSLYNYLESIVSGEKGHGRTKTELMKNAGFVELMEKLRSQFASDPNIRLSQKYKDGVKTGHPKMQKLEEVVVNHFNNFLKDGSVEEKSQATRVMIFSQYRDSVSEITDILMQHQPLVKVMSFIGQSSAGKATKGFTQKEQLKVMKKFREGGYNTLVSTCVGEEGLDIGEVDLIVCFDAHKSPIRLVQRMGRTGRKREGRIIMLVTEGKEEQIYNQSQYSKKSIHKAILNGAKSLHFYQNNPRMVPEGWMPSCHKMHISLQQNFQTKDGPKVNRDSKQKKLKFQSKSATDTRTDDGLLTTEEYRDLIQNYAVPEDSIPTLPSRLPLLTLGEKHEKPAGERQILREWLPWQNRLQQTYKIDHSTKTKHFVELMQFIEIQQTLDPNEDPYGEEMSLFLNEEDVLKPGETNGRQGTGIRKFCVAVEKEGSTAQTIPKNKGRQFRKSDVLPTFEISSNEESEEDLPNFNINRNDKRTSFQGNKKGKAGKRQLLSKSSQVFTDIPESKSIVKKSKKDKKRSVSGDRSVVQLIVETEDNDFTDEEENMPAVLPPLDEITSPVNQAEDNAQNNQNEIQDDMESSDINYSPLMDSQELMEVDDEKEKESSFSQLLPKIPPSDIGQVTLESAEILSNTNVYRVRTPPPLEQVGEIVAELDKCEKLPPLDLLQLVDEWEKENQEYQNRKGSSGQFDESDFKDKSDQSGKDQGLGPFSVDERSSAGDKSVTSYSGRKMSEPMQDIQIHIARQSPSKDHQKVINSKTNLKHDYLDISACQERVHDKGKQCLKSVPDDNMLSPINKPHVPVRNSEDDDDDVLSDDSGFILDTQANFSLAVYEEEGPFEIKNKSVTCDNIQNSPLNVTSQNVSPQNDMSVMKERGSTLSSDDEFFDTQANFSLHNEDLFGDDNVDQINTDTKHTSSSTISDNSGNFRGQECPKNVEKIRFVNKQGSLDQESTVIEKVKFMDDIGNEPMCSEKYGKPFSEKYSSNSRITAASWNLKNLPAGHRNTADTSLFDDSYDKEMLKMTLKTQGSSVVSPTQFTFTQALACVHDSNELLSEDSQDDIDLEKEKKNGGNLLENMTDFFNSIKEIKKSCQAPETECNKAEDKNQNTRDVTHLDPDSKKDSTNNITDFQPSEDIGNSSDEGSKDSFDIPHFDLGFDVDEDIIPPSPCASQSISQKSFSASLSQSLLKSRKSLSTKFDSTCGTRKTSAVESDKVGSVAGMSIIEEDSLVLSNHKTIIQSSHMGNDLCEYSKTMIDSSSKTALLSSTKNDTDSLNSGRKNEANSKGVLNMVKSYAGKTMDKNLCKPGLNSLKATTSNFLDDVRETKVNHSTKDSNESVMFGDMQDKNTVEKKQFVCNIRDRISAPAQGNRPYRSPSDIQTCTTSKTGLGTASYLQETLNVNKQNFDEHDGFSPVCDRSLIPVESLSSESDDDIVVRKKRKAIIIDSPSPSFTQKKQHMDNQTTPFRTPGEPSNANKCRHEKDTKKLKFNVSFKLPEIEELDDDDFADDKSALVKDRLSVASKTSRNSGRSSDTERKVVKKRTKSKSPADMFIHGEAEVSDDEENVSGDEDDGSDMDQMEDSFIGEATQMSQGRAEDMHAFYLKSVRSPLVGGKFRLKYDQGNMDVFSQPHQYDDSHYMEDSFCVDDDFEETGVDLEEAKEITMLEDADITYVGRRTRWSKPAAIHKKKARKHLTGRKRIRKISNSSSEEESYKCDVSKIQTPQVSAGKRRRRVLLSSSTSEEEPDCKVVSPLKITSPAEGTPDIIPSLMTRIKNNHVSAICISELRSKTESHHTTDPTTSCDISGVQSDNASAWFNTSHKPADRSVSGLNTNLTAEQLRVQRLQKQKEKQEEFKRRMAQKAQDIYEKSKSPVINSDFSNSRTGAIEVPKLNCDISRNDEQLLTSAKMENNSKSVIFVDSREINGSQNIVSELRFKHNMSVIVAQLAGCDYVVSNRMGVDRKVWSEFTNGSNRAKLVDRIHQLCDLYDRPCLIIESDPVKGSDKGGNRLLHWTKYVDKTIVQLINSNVKMYFTSGQLDTAAILADLCLLEMRKNMAISVPVNVSDKKQQHIRFYSSFPKLTHVHSLNLTYNFRTIKDFLSASVQTIRTKGCMSEKRAEEVFYFIRRNFDA
ncbi:Fanconi anemia group M protein-like [Ylistrum balloti]|uniref:Fanconi anemia group M protein-like n=1 Tax=Ylistrum balloti TaxID=509963 RepID=UPI002905A60B|nr:Fanconi anemia group M protein-like [Ylistrum balloti]